MQVVTWNQYWDRVRHASSERAISEGISRLRDCLSVPPNITGLDPVLDSYLMSKTA